MMQHTIVSEHIATEMLLGHLARLWPTEAVHVAPTPSDVRLLAKTASRAGAERIVVIGGDGTIHAAVQGVAPLEQRPRLAFVPGGTANDAALGLGLPADPLETLEALAAGRLQPVPFDLVRCNDRWLVNVMSIGLPAAVTATTPAPAKHLLGSLAYLAHGLSLLPGLQAFPAAIEAEGLSFNGRAYALYIGNLPYAGGGFEVCPGARYDDGALDLLLVPYMDSGNLLALLGDATLFGDPRNHEFVEQHRLSSLRIDLPPGTPVNLDGEPYEASTLELTVCPGHLSVYCGTQA